eukprot:SM000063S20001  [mRNA]  locus=s63:253481:255587:+ [translate_table: standard]
MAQLTSREKRALGGEIRRRQVAGKLEHAMLAVGRPYCITSAVQAPITDAARSLPISPAHLQELAGRRSLRALLRTANAMPDPLAASSATSCFSCNGVDVRLHYATGQNLPRSVQACLLGLLEVPTPKPFQSNMQRYHGAAWLAEAKLKQAQLVEDGAKYILIIPNVKAILASGTTALGVHRNSHDRARSPPADDPTEPQGFVQFRFVEEEGMPVLYVYELQLGHPLQRCGLGSFLMRLMEGVAQESSMVGVMLTVQTKNTGALDFYLRKLNYEISPISPNRVTSEASNSKYDYVILQKISDAAAKKVLEARGQACLEESAEHSGRRTERLSQL